VIGGVEPACRPGLLLRIRPFERWVISQLYVYSHPIGRLTADSVGADCGLPAWRIREVAEPAIGKMPVMLGMAAV
jgi:hypothetical protein